MKWTKALNELLNEYAAKNNGDFDITAQDVRKEVLRRRNAHEKGWKSIQLEAIDAISCSMQWSILKEKEKTTPVASGECICHRNRSKLT